MGSQWIDVQADARYPALHCPVLAAFGRGISEGLPEVDRQQLSRVFRSLIAADSSHEMELNRAEFLARGACSELLPVMLDMLPGDRCRSLAADLRARSDIPLEKLATLVRDARESTAAAANAMAAYAAYAGGAPLAIAYAAWAAEYANSGTYPSAAAEASAATYLYASRYLFRARSRSAASAIEAINGIALSIFERAISIA